MSGGLDSTGTPLALTETFSYQTIRTDKPDYPPGSPSHHLWRRIRTPRAGHDCY